ncbi:unnamed protein product [Effrenium voratum]|nr:unnamed protein product [Effrenium voratum]
MVLPEKSFENCYLEHFLAAESPAADGFGDAPWPNASGGSADGYVEDSAATGRSTRFVPAESSRSNANQQQAESPAADGFGGAPWPNASGGSADGYVEDSAATARSTRSVSSRRAPPGPATGMTTSEASRRTARSKRRASAVQLGPAMRPRSQPLNPWRHSRAWKAEAATQRAQRQVPLRRGRVRMQRHPRWISNQSARSSSHMALT